MIKTVLASSRFVIGLAVIATFIGSVTLLIISTLAVIRIVWEEIDGFGLERLKMKHVEHVGVQFIQVTDTILLGTVMYIIALGLYQLFINQNLPLPRWLRVTNLMELKRDLLNVTVVLLGVTFLGEVVDWEGGNDILILGAAIALVVTALGFILWLPHRDNHGDSEEAH